MAKKTRDIECEIFIGADPARVWRALTEADQIVNWFALKADSQPGVGGHISLSWDLKAIEPGRCHILDWQPESRLLMTWRDAPGGENELPVEITLAGREGGTLLRLVHSGFLSDTSWDDEYESHSRGWNYELRSLKFYLENQFGRTRRYVLERFQLGSDDGSGWRNIVGPSGIFKVAVDDLVEGADFTLGLPPQAETFARLLYALDGRDFAAAADVLRGGLFRISVEFVSGLPEMWVWAFSWNMGQEELAAVTEPIYHALRARLGSHGGVARQEPAGSRHTLDNKEEENMP